MTRVARCDGKLRGRFCDHLHHPMAIQKNFFTLDFAPCILKNRQRFGVQKFNSNIFQYSHRAVMDSFNAVFRQRFDWTVCIFDHAPRHLFNRSAISASISSTSTASASRDITHHHLQRLLDFKMPKIGEVCGQIATFSIQL